MTLKPKLNHQSYNWGDKIKIETGAVGDTKTHVTEFFRGLVKKSRLKCIISKGGCLEEDRIVIDKQINTFWKNLKYRLFFDHTSYLDL